MPLDYKNYPGLIEKGNLDLSNRKQVPNPEAGGTSSVWSMSVGIQDKNGKEITVVIPRLKPDGTIMSEQDAFSYFKKTGQHMGKFQTVEEADRFSKDYSKSLKPDPEAIKQLLDIFRRKNR